MACWFLALGLKFKAVRRGVGQRGTGRPTAELRQCTHRDRGVQHRFCTMVQVHPGSGAHCISVHGALHAISVHNTLHLCSRHAASYAASYAASLFTARRETGRVSPMRHTPPFSLKSSPPTKPGQPGYLRGVLCALGYSVAPIRGLVTDNL